MVAGTGSDVGKSLIAAGLCRIFMQDGYTPAPFKAQNMALNSFATPDGKEIGRAQAVQAEAAGIPCSTDMNPVLLKPCGDMTAQVVLNGVPVGNFRAGEYFRREYSARMWREVCDAYRRLRSRHNPVVMEGAGSISELNLRDTDIVNMPMAREADAAVILVADIDRGGIFASVYGSIKLQTPGDQKLIKGVIINKFRGDISLFEKGRRMLEEICGVPVLGVVPYAKDIHIEEEDSLARKRKGGGREEGKVNVAVALARHISNFTDFDTFERIPGVNLYYTASPRDIEEADIIILPGSKTTVDDLIEFRSSGMTDAIIRAHEAGKTVVGICGGYQMMGEEIRDPGHIEGATECVKGLGILPVVTEIEPEKITRRVRFSTPGCPGEGVGYEIHAGRSRISGDVPPMNILSDGSPEGVRKNQRTMGTYIHGILDNPSVLRMLLSPYMRSVPDIPDPVEYKERQYDSLAELLRKHLDINKLYEILRNHD